MQIIKLDAIDSTNLYLKDLSREQSLEDFTVVVANVQHQGRGQMGSNWNSEGGKNLTFSVLKKFQQLALDKHFTISICTALAIYDSLMYLKIPDLKVKWPNDIMSGNTKICGILVENRIEAQFIKASILGIGLNVNQTIFSNLKNAGSLKSITGNAFDLEDLLQRIVDNLKHYFQVLSATGSEQLRQDYELALYRLNSHTKFKLNDGNHLNGIIRGVSKQGKLQVENEEGELKEYGLKQLTLVY